MVFDKNRYGFGVIGNKLVIMQDEHREMKTKDFLDQVCGMDYTSIRGYITRDRIQFFDGGYGTSEDVTQEMMDAALNTYMRLYEATLAEAVAVPVYNGVRKGEEGVQWPPVLEFCRETNEWVVA